MIRIHFVDPEPPGQHGGGIRAYIRHCIAICASHGTASSVLTHNPEAYEGCEIVPIGRSSALPPILRWLAYRYLYHENVLLEHSRWIFLWFKMQSESHAIIEFPDFLGYAFFTLRDPSLRGRCVVRVHTPAYLIPTWKATGILAAICMRQREKQCLRRAQHISVPSGRFMEEKIPWLMGWTYLPNPLPPRSGPSFDSSRILNGPPGNASTHFLYLGRIEERKGVAVLLEAFLLLLEEEPEASLAFVGGSDNASTGTTRANGTYSRALEKRVEDLPEEKKKKIRFLPACSPSERSELFGRCHVLVIPSLWENSPYVFFEGMAAGLLCLATDTGEMKTALDAMGRRGAVPGSPHSLLKHMLMAIQEPDVCRRMIQDQFRYLEVGEAGIPNRIMDYYQKLAADP